MPPNATGRDGFWQAGTKLCIGAVIFPRGATLSHDLVASLPPGRLAVLMGNRMVIFKLGGPDPNAPASVPVVTWAGMATRRRSRHTASYKGG
jgi:hypothetical protein